MNHPEALLLPILMIGDYLLTVIGAVEREKKHSMHFKMEQYELNPVWQRQIAARKWFNPRHIIFTIVLSGALIYLLELGTMPDAVVSAVLGCVLVVYGMILGRHFSNLLIFRHLIRKPDEVAGEIRMSHRFVLSLSLYQTLIVLIPLALTVFFSQSWFGRGGVVGVALFLIIHLGWIRKAGKQKGSSDAGIQRTS